jgi:hypothetical protein
MLKWISRVVIAVAVLVVGLRLADSLVRRSGSLPPVPQPNGYETLLTLAGEVTLPPRDVAELSPDAVRQIGEANRASMERLRAALQMESGVPLRAERGWGDKHAEDTKKLKRLAIVLGVQSRAEWLSGRTNEAAGFLVDMIQLGQALARGGILVDGINALVVETIGVGSLRAQLPHLDAAFCRDAARELERAETRRERPERILECEKEWAAASFGIVSRFGGFLLRRTEAKRQQEFAVRYHDTVRRTRRLMVALAARAVELEMGRRVTDTAELVPGILRTVPLDPERATPLGIE